MNSAQIDLALVLSRLGLPLELKTFNQRLVLQKTIYLSQVLGLDLGYRFSWYIRGPYSSRLTEDAFALVDEAQLGDKDFEQFELRAEFAHLLEKFDELKRPPEGIDISTGDWLELLASLHYLRHIAYRRPEEDRDFESAFAALILAKSQFKDRKRDAELAWQRLETIGLIEQKVLA